MPQSHLEKRAVLDLDAALDRAGGDIVLLREIAALFADECPLVIQQLHAGLAERNSGAVARAAHGLKGSAANFNAAPAVEIAARIERLAGAGRIEECAALIEVLENALHTLLVELEQI